MLMTPYSFGLGVVLSFVVWNVAVFLRYGWDKRAAKNGHWRVSEGELLTLAFLGASPGAKLAQRVFRHKTTKQPFARMLNLIVGFHIAAVLIGGSLLLLPEYRHSLFQLLSVPVHSEAEEGRPSFVKVNRGL